jgi:hypothetical protein
MRLLPPSRAVGALSIPYPVNVLKGHLSHLDNLLASRATLVTQLRGMAEKDDITHSLPANPPGGYEAIYAEHLRKYEPLCAQLRQNLQEQDRLLALIAVLPLLSFSLDSFSLFALLLARFRPSHGRLADGEPEVRASVRRRSGRREYSANSLSLSLSLVHSLSSFLCGCA